MFYRIKVNILKFLQFNTQWSLRKKKPDNVTRANLGRNVINETISFIFK